MEQQEIRRQQKEQAEKERLRLENEKRREKEEEEALEKARYLLQSEKSRKQNILISNVRKMVTFRPDFKAVSYTHLTLPTIYSV